MRISVWQARSRLGNVSDNLWNLWQAAERAKAGGAELLVAPEMFLTGYSMPQNVAELAEDDPLGSVAQIAKSVDIAIVVGGPEIIGGKLYNSAVFVDNCGNERTRYQKVQLFGASERMFFSAGERPPEIVAYRGVRIGMLICYDVQFPERVREAAVAGADLIAVPTAQMRPYTFCPEHMIKVRAFENHVHVAYANHWGTDSMNSYAGLSTIADPLGRTLAMGAAQREDLIFAEIDPDVRCGATAWNDYLRDVVRRDAPEM